MRGGGATPLRGYCARVLHRTTPCATPAHTRASSLGVPHDSRHTRESPNDYLATFAHSFPHARRPARLPHTISRPHASPVRTTPCGRFTTSARALPHDSPTHQRLTARLPQAGPLHTRTSVRDPARRRHARTESGCWELGAPSSQQPTSPDSIFGQGSEPAAEAGARGFWLAASFLSVAPRVPVATQRSEYPPLRLPPHLLPRHHAARSRSPRASCSRSPLSALARFA